MIGPFPNLPLAARGRVVALTSRAPALAGNPWNDPPERDVFVYTPPGYDADDARYPAVLVLPGFASAGEKLLARGLTERSIAARIDHLLAAGTPPFLAVLPDCMTSVGGSQYIDSPVLGPYASYLRHDVLSLVDTGFRTTGRWGVAGKSSGGFGALRLAMSFPGAFEAVACHSGDLGFDLCYLEDIAAAVRAIGRVGTAADFVHAFWRKQSPGRDDFAAMNILCMSAAYARERIEAPFPARLPMDPALGAVDFAVLESWRAHDPIERVVLEGEGLSSLRLLWIDCGDRDEHLLHLGARRLVERLKELDIAHRYEEFPGGHRGTSHRYDVSLPALVRVLVE
jgi:enterochelin esterase family protein